METNANRTRILISLSLGLGVLTIAIIIFIILNMTQSQPAITLTGGTAINPPKELSNVTLTANSGDPFNLSELEQYTLVYFGYTHCPDACPATLLDYRRIKRGLGDLGDQISYVMVSVDPERDTAEFLDRYLERYDPAFIGLTGDTSTLDDIATEFGVTYGIRENEGSNAGYLVDHTASKFLLDPKGRLIGVYSFGADTTSIIEDLRTLLN